MGGKIRLFERTLPHIGGHNGKVGGDNHFVLDDLCLCLLYDMSFYSAKRCQWKTWILILISDNEWMLLFCTCCFRAWAGMQDYWTTRGGEGDTWWVITIFTRKIIKIFTWWKYCKAQSLYKSSRSTWYGKCQTIGNRTYVGTSWSQTIAKCVCRHECDTKADVPRSSSAWFENNCTMQQGVDDHSPWWLSS